MDQLTIRRREENVTLPLSRFVSFIGSEMECHDGQLPRAPQHIVEDEVFQHWLKWIKAHFQFQYFNDGSPYPFQKHIPSARSIHSLVPFLIYSGHLFMYSDSSNMLHYIGYHESKRHDVELVVGVDVWRTCSVYGSFGLALCLLELGHMIGSLKIEAKLKNMSMHKTLYMFHRSHYLKLFGMELPSDMLMGCVCQFHVPANASECHASAHATRTFLHDYRKRYTYQQELMHIGVLHYMTDDALNSEVEEDMVVQSDWKLPDALQHTRMERSSDHTYTGLLDLSKPMKKEVWDDILTLLEEVRQHFIYADRFSIYVVVQQVEGVERGVYDVEKGKCTLRNANVHLREVWLDPYDYMNVDVMPSFFYVTYKAEEKRESRDIYYAHVFAGEMMQSMSRYLSSTCNMYVRPVKSYRDDILAEITRLDHKERIIYGVLAGTSHASNKIGVGEH
ncbi:hypothetical protein [Longirhabdus pacifica]|uniref:hypothetical protein n=1 Tax=Longirhabdus pacifica TaxID=2305227 RepID=UPI0010087C75|nr:hypothetical protein [Longirhabdus pacifica]